MMTADTVRTFSEVWMTNAGIESYDRNVKHRNIQRHQIQNNVKGTSDESHKTCQEPSNPKRNKAS